MKKIIFGMLFCAWIIPAQAATIRNMSCDPSWQPGGNTTQKLVDMINSASKTILVMSYEMSSLPITNALIAAEKRGVDVKVILDKVNLTASYSKLPELKAAGIKVWIDSKHRIFHHKITDVDNFAVEFGSFNYSYSAEHYNAEDAWFCHSHAAANAIATEFALMQAESIQE